MSLSGAFNAIKSSSLLSWKSVLSLSNSTYLHTVFSVLYAVLHYYLQTGKLQQTIANCIEKTGRTLHSGKLTTVKIFPEFAGEGRYFHFNSKLIRASIDFAQYSSPLCTTLSKDDHTVRTVEHLLSALEASGVDNCRIEIINPDPGDLSTEV